MDLTLLGKVLALCAPVLCGGVLARSGVLGELDAALRVMNAYALRIAFPALVCVGLMGSNASMMGTGWWSVVVWAGLWPLALALWLGVIRVFAPASHRGSLGLAIVFGNVAYLGLPIVKLLAGEQMLGVASWIVSVHVTLGVTVGAWWAMRHGESSDAGGSVDLRAIGRQPLVWAPVVGGGLLWGKGSAWQKMVGVVLEPLATSAAPVALCMLGVYLWSRRALLWRRPDGATVADVLLRLCGVPALVAALVWVSVTAGWMSEEIGQVHVLLTAMPVGITTFSIAYDARCAPERVARAIVWSTVLCGITIAGWWGLTF